MSRRPLLALLLLGACRPEEPPRPPADLAFPIPDGGPFVIPGHQSRTLLRGTLVTPDEAYEGTILIEGATLACVAAGEYCANLPEAAGATVVDSDGIIAPGLIDTHNHILFDIFDNDDWSPAKRYLNHDEWPKEARYQAMLDVKQCLEDASIGKPAWCPGKYDGAGSLRCEMLKWGELKGLLAGTTSIVGLPGNHSPCFASLARTVDGQFSGLAGSDAIQTSSLFPPSTEAADIACRNMASGKTRAYLIHCGEGLDFRSRDELNKLFTAPTQDGCLFHPATVITHGTAFEPADFQRLATAGMKLTWSPQSNVSLYGATTNIPAALEAKVLVTLGPDWSMGGSQNLLDELRFADRWDNDHFKNRLTAADLVRMATVNGAKALGLGDKLGNLATGLLADLVVIRGDRRRPYEAIVNATPLDVRLTIVNGKALYGDWELRAVGPAEPGCEALNLCGRAKFLCVATKQAENKLDQTLEQIQTALETALKDVDQLTPKDGWSFAPLAPLYRCP